MLPSDCIEWMDVGASVPRAGSPVSVRDIHSARVGIAVARWWSRVKAASSRAAPGWNAPAGDRNARYSGAIASCGSEFFTATRSY